VTNDIIITTPHCLSVCRRYIQQVIFRDRPAYGSGQRAVSAHWMNSKQHWLLCTMTHSHMLYTLKLLYGWQVRHLTCKKLSGGYCHGYLSGARCRFAYGSVDATATHCLLLQ